MTEWLLIDGYNVINNWSDFAALREESMEHARHNLTAVAAEYGAFRGQNVIIVFDAPEGPGGIAREEQVGTVSLVYTAEGETADSWIERRAYELVRTGEQVFVVTGDYSEQLVILGAGAYRISSREFREDYRRVKRQVKDCTYKNGGYKTRNEVGNRLEPEIISKLERLRR